MNFTELKEKTMEYLEEFEKQLDLTKFNCEKFLQTFISEGSACILHFKVKCKVYQDFENNTTCPIYPSCNFCKFFNQNGCVYAQLTFDDFYKPIKELCDEFMKECN